MMRMVSVMSLLLALHAGCSNQNKKAEPRVEKKDAAQVVTTDGPSAAQATVAQIVTLFHEATGGTPYPAIDRLRQVMRAQPADTAAAALEVMADPQSKTDSGVGLEAMFYLDDWLGTKPDEAARKRTSQALERVIATAATYMRTSAYSFLAERRLPDAQRILIAEVENPERDARERDAAGAALGAAIDDFELIRSWLSDDQPLHWEAALPMLKTFDAFNDGNKPLWDEGRALLVALARRRELPAPVVYDLAFYFEIYLDDNPADAEIRALAERWAKHPDDMAAGQMKKIL